jgi:inner membrane protein
MTSLTERIFMVDLPLVSFREPKVRGISSTWEEILRFAQDDRYAVGSLATLGMTETMQQEILQPGDSDSSRITPAVDNLCHTLVGAALGEAGLARRKPLATATLLIGANLPDVDGFTYAFLDGPTSLAFRRGWTHGILAMAVLPVALAAAMVAWDQMVRRRPGKSRGQAQRACTRRSSRIPARFRALLIPAFAAVLSHPLLDFLNTYGVRFLYPFSKRWFYGDTLFIVDPWVWIALAFGIAASRVLRKREKPRSHAPARAALAVVATYVAVMMSTSFVGRGIARRAAIAAGLRPSGRVLVAPLPLVPHRRMVLIETGKVYRFGELRWTPRPVVAFDREVHPVYDLVPEVAAAKRLRPFRQFLEWARFPYYDVRRTGESAVVTARDARYPGPAGSWAAVSRVVPAKPPGLTLF